MLRYAIANAPYALRKRRVR